MSLRVVTAGFAREAAGRLAKRRAGDSGERGGRRVVER